MTSAMTSGTASAICSRLPLASERTMNGSEHQYDQGIEGGRKQRKRRDRQRRDAEEDEAEVDLGERGLRHVEQEASASPQAAGDRRGQDVQTSPRSRLRDIRIGGEIPSIAVDAKGLVEGQRGAPCQQGGMRHGIPHHRDQERAGDQRAAGCRRRVQIHHADLLCANAFAEVRAGGVTLRRCRDSLALAHAGDRSQIATESDRAAGARARRRRLEYHAGNSATRGSNAPARIGHSPRFEKRGALRSPT